MCLGCYERYGSPRIATDATRHAARLIEAADPFGALHCVVEDDNYEDEHLAACRQSPLTPLDAACLDALEALTPAERVSAAAIANGWIPAYPSTPWTQTIHMDWREIWPADLYGDWSAIDPDLVARKIEYELSDEPAPLLNPEKASRWPR